mgnify:CR=1 FL=1
MLAGGFIVGDAVDAALQERRELRLVDAAQRHARHAGAEGSAVYANFADEAGLKTAGSEQLQGQTGAADEAKQRLDELDRELENRGHRFVRYADDCNIYVRSERSGQRVMNSITRFITTKLKYLTLGTGDADITLTTSDVEGAVTITTTRNVMMPAATARRPRQRFASQT